MPRPRAQDLRQEALALLDHGLDLLVSSGWARGAYARDRHRHRVSPTSPRAVRYCMTGALIRAELELHGEPFEEEGEEAIAASDRLLLALSYLGLACTERVIGSVLRTATGADVQTIARALEAPFHQLPDIANEVPGVLREHVYACYLLAIAFARQAAAGTRQPTARSSKQGRRS